MSPALIVSTVLLKGAPGISARIRSITWRMLRSCRELNTGPSVPGFSMLPTDRSPALPSAPAEYGIANSDEPANRDKVFARNALLRQALPAALWSMGGTGIGVLFS